MKNREIKFRAWDLQDKTMREVTRLSNPYPSYTKGNLGKDLCWVGMKGKGRTNTSNPKEVNNKKMIILMQYTGLKDKNGKEIYEGDIIRGKWKEAKINPEGISVCPPISEGFHFYSEMEDREDEIIGNIYENPELLN